MEKENLTLDDFLSRFQLLRPQVNRATLNQRQAAVLIPVVRREQPGLLLTQRSPHMRKHAGQVAFPGGAVDSTDASLIAAAFEVVDATPMEGFDPAKLDEILKLRERGLRSVAIVALGYRAAEGDWLVNLKKVRRPREQFVTEVT